MKRRLATLQEKEDNKENHQVEKQEWLLEDTAPDPIQSPEQEAGNTAGKGIQ